MLLRTHTQHTPPYTRLGSGTYGVVRAVHDPARDMVVAVKTVSKNDDNTCHLVGREIAALRACNGMPGSVAFYSADGPDDGTGEVRIKMELCATDVQQLLHEDRKASGMGMRPELRHSLVMQLVLAIGHLHSRKLSHRDIKPSNLGVGHDGQLKLLDFGLARRFEHAVLEQMHEDMPFTACVVTMPFAPPEILWPRIQPGTSEDTEYMQDALYSPAAVDMWSVGVTIVEIVHAKHENPFSAAIWSSEKRFRNWSQYDILLSIAKQLGSPKAGELGEDARAALPKFAAPDVTFRDLEAGSSPPPPWVLAVIRGTLVYVNRLTARAASQLLDAHVVSRRIVSLAAGICNLLEPPAPRASASVSRGEGAAPDAAQAASPPLCMASVTDTKRKRA